MTGLQVLQALERWQEVDQETAVAIDRFGDDRNLIFTRAAALERLDQVEESEALFRQLVDQRAKRRQCRELPRLHVGGP